MSSNISLSTLSNNAWTSSSTSNIVNTSSPFVVNSGSNSAITVDSDGNTVIEKLVLKDEKTGRKWQLKISDGEIIVEPLEIQDKREWKIEKVLNENI
jgi:hypothetical protein